MIFSINLRIVFKSKDCKLQFYEKRGLFCYLSVNPCMPASRWRRLLKLKRKKNYFKIIIGFFFTPPLFLATKVAISFVYCSPKTIKCTQKTKMEKKFTGIDQSSERASECHSPHRIYNSRVKNEDPENEDLRPPTNRKRSHYENEDPPRKR